MRCRHITVMLLVSSCCLAMAMGQGALVAEEQTKSEIERKDRAKPADKKQVTFWMEKKLEYTQEILRGLALGDLPRVVDKAEQMRRLAMIEGWVRNRKPGYRAQFQSFELANAEILRNAKANKLDGATVGFQQLTSSCVSCHKLLRDVD